ncbi:MAG: histidine kinase [Candidatus Azobacteroides sp.]|nr:histidine kinase [Candidatus Azobacteroides sp.]
MELSQSLKEGKSDEELAGNYEKLAREWIADKEYSKAEENFVKAKNIFIKLKKEEEVARIERELAKLQEMQNNIKKAISTYQSAGKISKDKNRQAINESDAQRLMNQSNAKMQSELINQKIELLEEASDAKEEIQDAYVQMAQVNLSMKQPEKAISNYEEALKKADKPEDEIKITREMAQVYASNQQMEKAIELDKSLVEKIQKTDNLPLEIEQLQNLSSAYFKNSDEKQGLQLLQEAYALAIAHTHTLEAQKSMELLVKYYLKHKREKDALDIYSDFTGRLETLIQSDSSLVDSKIVQINEERIAQLEKERMLKDELIRKKNSYNNILIAVIGLILVLLFFIIRAWLSIRVKNKKIALQSLRREMNPHFIFNSLNSVNQFIAQNNEWEANKYLSSYSKLMRAMMENSNKDFIPLSVELEQIKEYLQLENMRFSDKFAYSLEVDENLDINAVAIPNWLIQPQLENAVWHGLRYKDEKGHLWLKIKKKENSLWITIEDNGVGIRQSEQWKTPRQKEHQSRGLTNTFERIELLNKLYGMKIKLNIKEKDGEETGVTVDIQMPYLSVQSI